MAGTRSGGLHARDTNIKKYGEDFYKRIGAIGGKKGHKGGFWYAKHVLKDDNFAREAGRRGGKISRRTKQMDKA